MSNIKWVMGVAALAAFLTLGLAGTATAFHGGGVAHCDGCHSMHNSPENPVAGNANTTLLKGSDASSTCLNCHAGAGSSHSYHSLSTDATVWSPGGDFFWLTQSYTNTNWSGSVTSDPDNMGHNVIALDFGLTVDGTNTSAPGGGYPSALLGCQSCHDPHGQVASGGTANGQLPISVSGSYGAVPVTGTIATSWGCPFEGEVSLDRLLFVAEAIADTGVSEIAVADTIGVADPWNVVERVNEIRQVIGDIPLRAHFHNTRNTGIANAYAAVQAGVTTLDSSVGGLGGCPFAPRATGNIPTEDLVYMLDRAGIATGVDLDDVIAVSNGLAELMNHPLEAMLPRAGGFPEAS